MTIRNDMYAVWTLLTGIFATMLSVHAAEGGKSALVGQFSSSYYKDWPLFSTRADETKSVNVIGRFGPVGLSIELFQPAFQMRVMGIEKGSPAEACGNPEDGKFSYDGLFKANKKVLGDWMTVAVVPSIEAFDPARPVAAANALLKELSFKDGGLTSSKALIWSGDVLLDLNRLEVLKISPQTIGGADYLFIEAGGFSVQNKTEWKSPLVVLKLKGS